MRCYGFIAVTNTGVLSGIFHDLMEEIGKKASLRVNWVEEVGYENILPGWAADGTTFRRRTLAQREPRESGLI